MFDKSAYRSLLLLVNEPNTHDSLVFYATKRIESLSKDLERAETIDDIRRLQGRIYEMRRLLGLREEVRAGAE